MTTTGTVRMWNGEEGWGVIDSPVTPGGCWTHFSHVLARSYRHLQVGAQVLFEWEPGEQDGYHFRAVRVYLSDQPPGDPRIHGGRSGYVSTINLTFDNPAEDRAAD